MSNETMLPDRLPILVRGKQAAGSGAVCAEQAVNWLVSGRLDLGDETDRPSCVQPVVNALAIVVNDRLPDHRRADLWPLIPRQPGTARPEMEPALSVRLAAWCATQVLDVAGAERREAETAIAAAPAWCDDPSTSVAFAAAVCAAYATYAATYAAYAATYADYAAANANALLTLLAGCQDECERLTGHVPAPADVQRILRLGEMVGTR